MNYWGGGGGGGEGLKLVLYAQPHPQFLKWYKYLVGCSVRMITL